MDKVELPLSLRCPAHPAHIIGMLNVDPNAKKVGYCYECIAENGEDASLFKTLKTVAGYLKDSSSFYEKCRQRATNAGTPPAKYTEELLKKGERKENFFQHIDQEKEKVKRSFEEIRRIVNQIIDEKEKECLKLFDKEISGLSEAYDKFENLFNIGWPKPSDIQNIFPGIDQLKERISQIESMDQFQAFMTGIHEDVKTQDLYFKDENGLHKIKAKMDDLIHGFIIPDCSLPKIQGQILNLENLENLMKSLMKGFIQQEIQVEKTIVQRMELSTVKSKIIAGNQFETLRKWLPKGYNFDLKLLFRGSADGMSVRKFHDKCDGQGATITLIKCRFKDAQKPSILGGFIDQSWHSKFSYSSSKQAFLFSLTEQYDSSVKCPILDSHFERAFYGGADCGPRFGKGSDLYFRNDELSIGAISPKSYSNAIALQNGKNEMFDTEEIEVFKVL